MRKFGIALAAGVLLLSASTAWADGITDTFTGVVTSGSGNDTDGNFGAGDLSNDNFTLTFTLDPAVVSGQALVVSGITGTLTINGITQTLSDISGGYINPGAEILLAAESLGGQGVAVDLFPNIPIAPDLGQPLPSMLLSNGDFAPENPSSGGGVFVDPSGVTENLDLTVEAVNPVPEPGSLTLLATGLIGLALLLRRNAAYSLT